MEQNFIFALILVSNMTTNFLNFATYVFYLFSYWFIIDILIPHTTRLTRVVFLLSLRSTLVVDFGPPHLAMLALPPFPGRAFSLEISCLHLLSYWSPIWQQTNSLTFESDFIFNIFNFIISHHHQILQDFMSMMSMVSMVFDVKKMKTTDHKWCGN